MKSAFVGGEPLAYLDSSALVKLVAVEPESEALRRSLSSRRRIASSELAVVELLRAVGHRGDAAWTKALDLLSSVSLQRIDRALLWRAANLGPAHLRSLDAIHLATIETVRAHLEAVFTYDRRLTEAVGAAGIPTEAPGAF